MIECVLGKNRIDLIKSSESEVARLIDILLSGSEQPKVLVRIDHPNVKLCVSIPPRQSAQGTPRQPNAMEEQIFDLWDDLVRSKKSLSKPNFLTFIDHIKHLA